VRSCRSDAKAPPASSPSLPTPPPRWKAGLLSRPLRTTAAWPCSWARVCSSSWLRVRSSSRRTWIAVACSPGSTKLFSWRKADSWFCSWFTRCCSSGACWSRNDRTSVSFSWRWRQEVRGTGTPS
jgi:hypothetical protein